MSLKYSETHSTHGGACEARRGPQHEISGFPEAAAHEAKYRNDGFCTAVGYVSVEFPRLLGIRFLDIIFYWTIQMHFRENKNYIFNEMYSLHKIVVK